VNFNVNFNVLLSKYVVHPLVKIKNTLIILKILIVIVFYRTQEGFTDYALMYSTMNS
jgi:hypothetical protein